MQEAKMSNSKLVLVLASFLAGCEDKNIDGVKGAKGDTPVRYVICGPGESNCFVSARFKDIDGCESHKKWSEMLCDNISNPGKMICTQAHGAQIGFAYCTL